MTGLFSFDGPLYKDKNGVYCSTTLTNEMFSRYFAVVDKLYVVVRTFQSTETYHELNMIPLQLDNMEIVEVENIVSIKGLLFLRSAFMKRISGIIQKTDLIFARMPSVISDVVAEIAGKQKKRYLVEVGGCPWDAYWNHGLKGKIVAPYMFFRARKSIKNASFASYVTKHFLQHRYPNQGVTINCSNVYVVPKGEEVLSGRLEKIKNMDYKHPIIGQAVNSIDVPYKGEHLIIKALSLLKSKGIYPTYHIVGPGSGAFLKRMAKEFDVEKQVVFVGTLTKTEIDKWYRTIDLYVQPSKQEGLPRSVIEAMSNGCPALGSNIAGIPELLDKECLFNPDKIEMIVQKIEWILSATEMKKQAEANWESSKEYDIEILEARRKEFFLEYKNTFKALEKNETLFFPQQKISNYT